MFITRFNWVEDEHCDIYVEGKKVAEMDHGPHGWDGMVGIREAVTAVTKAAGGTVIITGEPGV